VLDAGPDGLILPGRHLPQAQVAIDTGQQGAGRLWPGTTEGGYVAPAVRPVTATEYCTEERSYFVISFRQRVALIIV
jgi:hypothetical protein